MESFTKRDNRDDLLGDTGLNTQAAVRPVTRIDPPKTWVNLELGELWKYRDLLYLFVWRDIKVRYKQTLVGVSWAIIQPFIAMVVLSVVFGGLARIPSGDVPYPLFAFSGLVPWTYFVTVLTQSTTSVVKNQTVITKIYFPRLIIPMTAVFIGLLDFCIAFIILFVMMLFYGVVPTAAVWTLPLFVILAIMTALGIGLWLAALNVRYRDVGFILPFLTQIWLFATPVVYPSSLVPGRWQVFYGLNPMAGVVEGFRWALLGKSHAPDMILIPSVIVATVVLVGGFYFFRHREHTFADEV